MRQSFKCNSEKLRCVIPRNYKMYEFNKIANMRYVYFKRETFERYIKLFK